MPVRMMLQVYRKPGMTFEDFRKHYEDVHVPLMKDLGGDLFPLAHVRRYVIRSGSNDDGSLKQQLSGASDTFPFDVLAELIFRDMEHFGRFSSLLQSEANEGTVADDCAKFMDVGRTATLLFDGHHTVETKAA